MSGIWYPTDGDAELTRKQFKFRDSADGRMATMLQEWCKQDDPRDQLGAIVLVSYADGFAIKYLGPEAVDEAELVRRVVWIGDTLREAMEPEAPE